MFNNLPRKDQFLLHSVLTGAWLFIAAGAASGLLGQRINLVDRDLSTIVMVSSAITVAFAFAAAVGVALDRYWWEWVASWVAAGGMAVYAVGLWWVALTGNSDNLQRASTVTAVVLFMCYRGLSNASHARRLRTIHDKVTTLLEEHDD